MSKIPERSTVAREESITPVVEVESWHKIYRAGYDPDRVCEIIDKMSPRDLLLLQMDLKPNEISDSTDLRSEWEHQMKTDPMRWIHLIRRYGERIQTPRRTPDPWVYEDKPGSYTCRLGDREMIRMSMSSDHEGAAVIYHTLKGKTSTFIYRSPERALEDFLEVAEMGGVEGSWMDPYLKEESKGVRRWMR